MESEQQFYEKGIIRQIPLFGSVFNWILPIEDKIIVGRSFSLHSGNSRLNLLIFIYCPLSIISSPFSSRKTRV